MTVDPYVGFVEFVEINVTFDHASFNDLEVELVSPSGARSRLTYANGHSRVPVEQTIRFGSARHLGENAAGTWTLHITDHRPTRTGTLDGWSLTVYGHGFSPGRPDIGMVVPGIRALTVDWTAPADTGGSAVTAYDLRYIESASAERSGDNWK